MICGSVNLNYKEEDNTIFLDLCGSIYTVPGSVGKSA